MKTGYTNDDRRAYERARRKLNTEINFQTLWQRKLQPCTDCKLKWHPHVMTFDHPARKSLHYTKGHPLTIGNALWFKPEDFNPYLDSLEVVCRNCHMVREAKRDIDDPKISYRNKQRYPTWFAACTGALVAGQVTLVS